MSHKWNEAYCQNSFADQERLVQVQIKKHNQATKFELAPEDPYFRGLRVPKFNEAKCYGVLYAQESEATAAELFHGILSAPHKADILMLGQDFTNLTPEDAALFRDILEQLGDPEELPEQPARYQGESRTQGESSRQGESVGLSTANSEGEEDEPLTRTHPSSHSPLRNRSHAPSPIRSPTPPLSSPTIPYPQPQPQTPPSSPLPELGTPTHPEPLSQSPQQIQTPPRIQTPPASPQIVQPNPASPSLIQTPPVSPISPNHLSIPPSPSSEISNAPTEPLSLSATPTEPFSPSPEPLSQPSTPTSIPQDQTSAQPSAQPSTSVQPSTSAQLSAQPSTSTQPSVQPPFTRSSAAAFFTPIPPQLETRLDSGSLLLHRLSSQLSELQASQQDGFRELAFRLDTLDVNSVKAEKKASGDFLMHTTRIINEVHRCFAQGGPNLPYVANVTAREDRLYAELRKAEDAAEKAAKGERDMRALNIRLLHEINDLRRQLNLSQYQNIPTDGDNFAAGQAEFDIMQRMKAAAAEEERYLAEQERINKMRQDSLFENTDDAT